MAQNNPNLPIDLFELASTIIDISSWEFARYVSGQHQEQSKDGNDAVTVADQAIEAQLEVGLVQLLPGSGVAGEEGMVASADQAQYRWVLDPIDGTINLARGYEFFTTVVSLLDNEGPLVAVVYQPAMDTVTIGVRGGDCRQWQLAREAIARRSEGRVLHVGDHTWDRSVHSVMLTPKIAPNARKRLLELTDSLLNETLGVRVLVSQAYEALKLAEGGVGGVISLQSSGGWSRDAARLLCESAGGKYAVLVSTEDPNIKGFMLVDSDQNFAKLAEKVQAVGYHIGQ